MSYFSALMNRLMDTSKRRKIFPAPCCQMALAWSAQSCKAELLMVSFHPSCIFSACQPTCRPCASWEFWKKCCCLIAQSPLFFSPPPLSVKVLQLESSNDSPSVIKLWRCAHTVNCANCTLLPCSLSVHWGRSLLWRLSYYSHVPLDVNLFWTALRINEEVWNHWGKWLYAVASVWGRSCRKQITRK